MTNKFINKEFLLLIKGLADIEEFQKTKEIPHHGITRYEHSMRVAYHSYKITKFLKLNYKETTIAALFHDFFIDEVKNENEHNKLTQHPLYAIKNANKYVNLTDCQIDIIKTHMFPITLQPPKYLESWIVNLVDDGAAIYEKLYSIRKEVTGFCTFAFILIINFLKINN